MPSTRAHINPDILVWARKRLNADPALIARRAGTSLDIYEQWENGGKRPTIKQLQKVAKQLRRPVSHFYLEDYPDEPEPRLEMRRVFGGNPKKDTFEFSREVQDCMRRREIALQLYASLGEEPAQLPETFDIEEDPEAVGDAVRYGVLNIDDETQSSWRGRYEALRKWREALERAGVLSFQISGVELSEARGFAFAKRPLPIAAFNSKDSVRGRIFTLLHEFAHILLGRSTLHSEAPFASKDRTESWCNRVAAVILVPKSDLLELQQVRRRDAPRFWTKSEIEGLASRYKVSPSAAIRRLQTFDLINSENFAVLSEQFDSRRSADAVQTESNDSSGGNFYSNKLTQLGSLLPSLAFRSFYANQISAGDLSKVMGTKVDNLGNFEEKVMGSRYAFMEA